MMFRIKLEILSKIKKLINLNKEVQSEEQAEIKSDSEADVAENHDESKEPDNPNKDCLIKLPEEINSEPDSSQSNKEQENEVNPKVEVIDQIEGKYYS